MRTARTVATYPREVAVPTTSPSAHLKAHRDRMPWASFADRTSERVQTWDKDYTLASRREAKARAADYR